MTGWPLVVCRWLTRTVQSFPYRRVLPGPAGFNINSELWRTEAPALGRAPGGLGSTFSSPFSLLIYRPQRPLVDPFPLSVCSQGTPKTVLLQYICFMISWEVDEEKTTPTPRLPPPWLAAPVLVNVRKRGLSAFSGLSALGGGFARFGGVGGCSVTSSSSMWIFHFPPPPTCPSPPPPPLRSPATLSKVALRWENREWGVRGGGCYICVSLTRTGQDAGSLAAHAVLTYVPVFAQLHCPTWSRH